MPHAKFHHIQDLALLAHYHLYRIGVYDEIHESFVPGFEIADATEFEAVTAVEGLIERRYLKRKKPGPHVITAKGILTIERNLGKPGTYLGRALKHYSPFVKNEPALTITTGLGDAGEVSEDDITVSIPRIHYGISRGSDLIKPAWYLT